MVAFEVQAKSCIERVAGFVPQDAQALGVSAALDLEHLLAFELHQARVRQVKRDGNAGHAVRREPLFSQPDMRFETDSARVQFPVKPADVRLQKRALDLDR